MNDIPSRKILSEIVSELRSASSQRAPTDDRVIAEHVDKALMLAKLLRDAQDEVPAPALRFAHPDRSGDVVHAYPRPAGVL